MVSKRDSELNNVLDNFHVTTGLPPDIAHDLLEGIVPYELALCFKYFIGKGYFTLSELNDRIVEFPYVGKDSVNRPQKICDSFKGKTKHWWKCH